MKKKYNLALIPISKSDQPVALAKQFSNIADGYLLGDKSLPHVTLYQLHAEDNEIDSIWNEVSDAWDGKPIDLAFNKFSCITFDNNIFWISLLPDNCDVLHEMHGQIANILKLPINKTFDPHMTLISTKNKENENEAARAADSYKAINDTFILALGASDEIGQLTAIIHCCDLKKNIACKAI